DEAAALKKTIVLPIAAIQQQGLHLPVDADELIVTSLASEVGRRRPSDILVAPTISYSYCREAMDFPGTISVAAKTFMDYCVAVAKGFAYHGFDHILLLNGFPANDNLVEFVGRQINLETQSLCASLTWTRLLTIDPSFNTSWRETPYPSVSHAGELETSLYLALDPGSVDLEHVGDYLPPAEPIERFTFEDAFGAGAVYLPGWASARSPNGVRGQPSKASAEKGKLLFEEAVSQLLAVLSEFRERPKRLPVDHHTVAPLGAPPFAVS
ncbi:MAG TPA: creatininase family protein, partial [Roseiflexaceae bacterium]|nr:creatininase family protein [Roseiflexaceae bacterium]